MAQRHEPQRYYVYKWVPDRQRWERVGWADELMIAVNIFLHCRAAEKQLWHGDDQVAQIGKFRD